MTNGSSVTSTVTNWPKYLTLVFSIWATVLPLSAWLIIAEVQELKDVVKPGQLQVSKQRLDYLERELSQHEIEHRELTQRVRSLERYK